MNEQFFRSYNPEARGLPKGMRKGLFLSNKVIVKKIRICECGKETFNNNRKYCNECRERIDNENR